METRLSVRRATQSEIPWIKNIHESLVGEEYLGAFYSEHDWWVLLNGYGKKVGFASGARDEISYEIQPGSYHFTSAWIDKQYRGLGGQKRLIRARIAHAKKIGCSMILTYTHHRNCASVNSLISCGFKSHLPEWAIYEEPWVSWKLKL